MVGHPRMSPFGSRERQHPLRYVDADHVRGSGRGQVMGELPGPAAEIEHPPADDIGQERQQVVTLRGPLPPGSESLEGRIAGEEARVVIDVLRVARGLGHYPFSWHSSSALAASELSTRTRWI